jgi:RNA polymerase sigma factor (sigma-70 family)
MATKDLSNLSDEILLTRIHSRDDNALETLIKRYERLLKTIIYYEIHNAEAEKDIYQETVFAIVRRIRRRSDDIVSVEQWMKQVARSKCKAFLIDVKKQSIIRNTATADAVLSTTEEQVQSYIRDRCQEEHIIEVWKIVEEMGSVYVDVLESWEQELSEAASAAVLNIPPNTVKSRRNKIRKVVRERFGMSFRPKK